MQLLLFLVQHFLCLNIQELRESRETGEHKVKERYDFLFHLCVHLLTTWNKIVWEMWVQPHLGPKTRLRNMNPALVLIIFLGIMLDYISLSFRRLNADM